MKERIQQISVFLSIGLIAYAAALPLLKLRGWYSNGDFDRYLYLIQEFRALVESGVLYPRWASRLMYGFGYPTFLFYQPGFFYALLPFTYVFALPHALYWCAFAIFWVSGLGAYTLARLFGHGRVVSVLFGAAYISMPYAYTNLYIRGDYSEFMAMMLCSWVMVGVFKLRQEAPGAFRYASLFIYVASLVAVFVTHPHVALFIVLVIAWFVLVVLFSEGIRSRFAHMLMLGGVAAATLSAPYWFTILQMSPLVALYRARRVVGQAVGAITMFVNSTPPGQFPGIHSVGIINVFFVLLAMAGLYIIRHRDKCLYWQVVPLLFLTLFLNTPMSLPLWHSIEMTSLIQFSWRISSVAGILILLGMMQLRFNGRMRRGLFALTIIAATMLQPYVQFNTETFEYEASLRLMRRFTQVPPPGGSGALGKPQEQLPWTFANRDEFTPRWLDSYAFPVCVNNHKKHVEVKAQSHITGDTDKDLLPYRIKGYVDIAPDEFHADPWQHYRLPFVVINQAYFPGWKAYVNGELVAGAQQGGWRESPSADKDPFGRIRIFFPRPGHYEVELYYDGPPHWEWRNAAIIVVLLLTWRLAVRLGLLADIRFRRRRAT